MTEEKESLAGRQWLVDKVDNSIKEGQTAIPAIENGICQRCGSSCWVRLPSGFLYCRAAWAWAGWMRASFWSARRLAVITRPGRG